jgi:hypothetical protein
MICFAPKMLQFPYHFIVIKKCKIEIKTHEEVSYFKLSVFSTVQKTFFFVFGGTA